MTGRNRLILIAAVTVATIGLGIRYAARRSTADSRFHGDVAHRVFDPSRDALKDLQTAEQQAGTQHKNILMDVGGNWCPSCIVLDRTLQSDPALRTLLAQNYVLLHVNWSSDNENKPLLSRYPQAHGYPALYVLSPTGQLVVVEDTSVFEQHPDRGETYNHASLQAFLLKVRSGITVAEPNGNMHFGRTPSALFAVSPSGGALDVPAHEHGSRWLQRK